MLVLQHATLANLPGPSQEKQRLKFEPAGCSPSTYGDFECGQMTALFRLLLLPLPILRPYERYSGGGSRAVQIQRSGWWPGGRTGRSWAGRSGAQTHAKYASRPKLSK